MMCFLAMHLSVRANAAMHLSVRANAAMHLDYASLHLGEG